MAGFGLGSNSFGGNFGAGQSGQTAPSGYGIQPPAVSPQSSMGYLGIGARSPQRNPADFYSDQSTLGVGPDTSYQHQENVQLGQLFGPQGMGLNYGTPGTSSSWYGMNPYVYQNINQYMMNPQGQVQGDSNYGTPGETNAGRYMDIVGAIRNAMTGNQNFAGMLPSQIQSAGLDMPLRFGSAFGTLPQQQVQNIGLPTPNLPGMRMYV